MHNKEGGGSHRILVIDEDPTFHADLKRILCSGLEEGRLDDAAAAASWQRPENPRHALFHLDSAYEGKEGLEKVTESVENGYPYALAFVDMGRPPEWDGVKTIEHLWEVAPDLHIAICSAHTDCPWSKVVAQWSETHRLLILKKPFDCVEVFQLAAALSEKQRLAGIEQAKISELEALAEQHAAQLVEVNQRLRNEVSDHLDTYTSFLETEQQLVQSERLESIGKLVGMVTHRFSNYLQVVAGYTRHAIDGLSPNDQRCQDLQEIANATHGAVRLTRQLASLGRRRVPEYVPLDLNEIVAELEKLLGSMVGEEMQLELILGEELGTINADAGELQYALLNLCIKACDAMPCGGRLTLQTENTDLTRNQCETISGADAGPHVLVSVTHTGTAAPAELQQRVFDPLHTKPQNDDARGLGLSEVHGIVRQHEGVIHVSNTPGRGTTFRIYFPAVVSRTRNTDTQQTPSLSPQARTILIADDDSAIRKLTARVLTKAGYEVYAAADGQEAVRMFEEHADEISLALLDVSMPQMGGREAFQRISALRPGIPVVYCTGYDTAAGEDGVETEQDRRVLQKPFSPADLLRTVQEILIA